MLFSSNLYSDSKKRIYADYASLTPIDGEVLKVVYEMERKLFNPSSIHKEGVLARKILNESRENIAKYFHSRKEEIVFTSSGTESINLAIRGVVKKYKNNNIPHVIISCTEHPATKETCLDLEKSGLVELSVLDVNENGKVDPEKVYQVIKENTVLISVMHANNETGIVNPVKDISRKILEYKKARNLKTEDYPFFHVDFSQSARCFDLNREKWGADMMTIDGGKIYGPRGIGVLMCRSYVPISSIITGGGQENELRAGTEHVALIAGLEKALLLIEKNQEKDNAKTKKIIKEIYEKFIAIDSSIKLQSDLENGMPDILNMCFSEECGLNLSGGSEFLVLKFDERGIACSSASACVSKKDNSSYVIECMEKGKNCANNSIRFSFGRFSNQKKDVDEIVKAFEDIKNEGTK